MSVGSEPTRSFIDTNVWLYGFGLGEDRQKTRRAKELIRRTSPIVLSTQVINEVSVNLLRKLQADEQVVRKLVRSFYRKYSVVDLSRSILLEASDLRAAYAVSFWDSLIMACAITAGAGTLYSEDLQDGLTVQGRLTIVNPLKDPASP